MLFSKLLQHVGPAKSTNTKREAYFRACISHKNVSIFKSTKNNMTTQGRTHMHYAVKVWDKKGPGVHPETPGSIYLVFLGEIIQ